MSGRFPFRVSWPQALSKKLQLKFLARASRRWAAIPCSGGCRTGLFRLLKFLTIRSALTLGVQALVGVLRLSSFLLISRSVVAVATVPAAENSVNMSLAATGRLWLNSCRFVVFLQKPVPWLAVTVIMFGICGRLSMMLPSMSLVVVSKLRSTSLLFFADSVALAVGWCWYSSAVGVVCFPTLLRSLDSLL